MIDFVSIEKSTYAPLPNKFEAGTPNIVGAISLGYAIDFVQNLGMPNIQSHSENLTNYLLEKFRYDNDIELIGNPNERISIISFLYKGAHPHDLALLLDKRGVALRAGHHCAQPAMRHFKVDTTLRASVGVYNDFDDIDYFVENFNDIKRYFLNKMNNEKKELESKIIEALQTVYDPEIPVSVYELGLIYDITINNENDVNITMTLTTPHCPGGTEYSRKNC